MRTLFEQLVEISEFVEDVPMPEVESREMSAQEILALLGAWEESRTSIMDSGWRANNIKSRVKNALSLPDVVAPVVF